MPTKHKINRADQAERGPKVIELDFLFHIKGRKSSEDDHGDHFLDDFELRKRIVIAPPSIGWDLKSIFEQCNSPAHNNHVKQRRMSMLLQVAVPREGHKDIRNEKHENWQRHEAYLKLLWLELPRLDPLRENGRRRRPPRDPPPPADLWGRFSPPPLDP